jgi:hypothetical protein
MKTSEVQIQRALLAALRKLNTGATFSVDVRTMNAQPATGQTVSRRSCSLRHAIDLILEQFENEEETNEEIIVKRY